ncbi:MAG: Veg family protein [Clostridia bacterium]|nr:Veg family protein [Clostridia bacterium]
MIKSNGSLTNVKEKIKLLYGREVSVKVNLGRNKFANYMGKVTGIYPALFTVSPTEEFRGKTTYSYSEVLCGNVFLKERNL